MRKTTEIPQGMWLGGYRRGSLWLCYEGLWLGDRKVGSQVVGENRSRLPGRRSFSEIKREGRASDRTKETDLNERDE